MEWLPTVALGIVSLYLIICLLFYFGQHLFFFRPEILPSHFRYEYAFPFEERTFETADGGTINAIHFTVPNRQGVVLYLNGNSRSIKGWGKFARDFLGKGYDFFMMDYRGFGKSRGRRSEKILYSDAQRIYDWLSEQYASREIIIYGRSFGSGIAAQLASKNKAKLLILDSPYYSFTYQIRRFAGFLPLRWLLKYHIPTYQYLADVRYPIYILHGDRDYLISFRQSVMLRDLYPDKVTLIPIKGGWHNNLPVISQYHEELYRILNK
jgi:alpha-beta hydrolase superfamily lysophospholipase